MPTQETGASALHFINALTIGMGLTAIVEQVTSIFGLCAVVLGCIASIYTILNQREARRLRRRLRSKA